MRCDGPSAGLADRVRDLLPHAVEVRLEYPRAETNVGRPSVAGLGARQLFARYVDDARARPAEEWELDLFERLLEEVDAPASA